MCKSCGGTCGSRRVKTVSGMNTKKIKEVIMTGAGVAAGTIIANKVGQLSFAQANPVFGTLLPIVGAVVAKQVLGKNGNGIALGMAATGINNAVSNYLPGVAAQAGLPSPGVSGTAYARSTILPGVSGNAGYGSIVFD